MDREKKCVSSSKKQFDNSIIEKFGEKEFKWAAFSGTLLSVLLFIAGSYYATQHNEIATILKECSMIVLGAVIVMFIQQRVLGDYFKNKAESTLLKAVGPKMDGLEERICDTIHEILPGINDATTKSIDDIRKNDL